MNDKIKVQNTVLKLSILQHHGVEGCMGIGTQSHGSTRFLMLQWAGRSSKKISEYEKKLRGRLKQEFTVQKQSYVSML